ncbi:MAG: class II aldolase/adducin family protein, partial [Alphaproteobacteria bacterium]
MKSLWSDKQASSQVAHYAALGVNEEVALRVYTTRLLGGDARLVMHGGGNTSVKTTMDDLLGDTHEVLCVKGSGWDMATIEPAGLPAVRIEPLRRLQERDQLSDEDMVGFQRANLLDSFSPNPSVETLLHAFLPHKFIDHTHSSAILAVSDQPDGEAICQRIFGTRMAIVPFIPPGFLLAKKAAQVFAQNPGVEGLILHKHGIFTFAETARQAYERMIEHVTLAENFINSAKVKTFASAALPKSIATIADVIPLIRGACAQDKGNGNFTRLLCDFRASEAILAYVNGREIADYGQRGVITPDHIIRVKNFPLVISAPDARDLDAFDADLRRRVG